MLPLKLLNLILPATIPFINFDFLIMNLLPSDKSKSMSSLFISVIIAL